MGPIGFPETSSRYEIATARYVTTQKSAVLIYFAAEARNHPQIAFFVDAGSQSDWWTSGRTFHLRRSLYIHMA